MTDQVKQSVVLVAFVVLAFGLLYLLLNRPVSHEERPVLDFDASSPLKIIEPGITYEQRFSATAEPLHGIVLFFPARHELEKMSVSVRNLTTNTSAPAWRSGVFVRGDSQRLTFLVPRLASHSDHVLAVAITNEGTKSLPLLTHAPGVIVFSIVHPILPALGFYGGVLAAGIFILMMLLADILPWPAVRQWWLARITVVVLPLFATPGFWFSAEKLGVGDWEYHFSLHEIYRRTVLIFHQVPLWNPYTCGGTSSFADPEFSAFTPTFLLELFLGVGAGTKAGIYFGLVVIGLGMLQLTRALGFSWRAGALCALVTTYSSALILRVVEGHVTFVFALMWLPWILWTWHNAYRTNSMRWQIAGGLFVTLTFFQGGIYILSYTILALGMLCLLTKKGWAAASAAIGLLLWGAGFSGVKLLPVLYWLRQYPDAHYVPSTATFTFFSDIFLRRHAHGSYIFPGQQSGWHEYGAYIGFIVLGVCLLALSARSKRRLVQTLLFATLLTTMAASLGPLLQQYFEYVSFLPRSNISRLNIFTVFSISLLTGIGLDVLYRRTPTRKVVTYVAVLVIAVDLLSYSAILSYQAFVLPEVFPLPSPAAAPLAYSREDYIIRWDGRDFPRTYAATLAGYGSFALCSPLGPSPAVATTTKEEAAPFVSIAHPGSATVSAWSPNTFSVNYLAPQATYVVVNMNYAPGWYVNGRAARSDSGRLTADVEAGEGVLEFVYRPPFLWLGLAVTGATLLSALYVLKRSKKYA